MTFHLRLNGVVHDAGLLAHSSNADNCRHNHHQHDGIFDRSCRFIVSQKTSQDVHSFLQTAREELREVLISKDNIPIPCSRDIDSAHSNIHYKTRSVKMKHAVVGNIRGDSGAPSVTANRNSR